MCANFTSFGVPAILTDMQFYVTVICCDLVFIQCIYENIDVKMQYLPGATCSLSNGDPH